ncbi:hypothetical protein, partial [uncultured Senegalimassilia sp.]|uniref:hypothetical protein n=1 Tax=uncultured Senegalimassilia sp. TaxID=1714350 RepID=UPI0025D637DD
FKQAKKRHRPAPMPLMRTHILSYKPNRGAEGAGRQGQSSGNHMPMTSANNRTRTKEGPAPTAIRRDAGPCGCKVADQAAPYA